uniref:Wall-associated receptor kinase galacturonan-binding domain-containing protein n=1 Tax=Oryza nivara TaxID=4536 RepID=A0A0E0IDZ1_ORYNI
MAIHPVCTSRPMKIHDFCKRTLADFDRRQTAILPPSHLACGIVVRVASGREVMTSSSSFCCLAASLLMLLLPFFAMAAAAAGGSSSSSNCTTICGGISIEYPFGVEPGCYHPGFNLTCNHSYSPPRLFLGDGTVQVLEIAIPQATVRINSGRMVFNSTGNHAVNRSLLDQVGRPYFVAASNRIALLSCNARVDVRAAGRNNNKTSTKLLSSCTAICPTDDGGGATTILDIGPEGPCSGIGCCETSMLLAGSSTASRSRTCRSRPSC